MPPTCGQLLNGRWVWQVVTTCALSTCHTHLPSTSSLRVSGTAAAAAAAAVVTPANADYEPPCWGHPPAVQEQPQGQRHARLVCNVAANAARQGCCEAKGHGSWVQGFKHDLQEGCLPVEQHCRTTLTALVPTAQQDGDSACAALREHHLRVSTRSSSASSSSAGNANGRS